MSDITTMNRTEYVTAFFDSEADAEAAVARIEAEGIPRDQIRIVAGDADAGLGRTRLQPSRAQKGFFEALGDLFMPEEDRYAYAEGLSRGGFLVSLYTTRTTVTASSTSSTTRAPSTWTPARRAGVPKAGRAIRPASPTQVGASGGIDASAHLAPRPTWTMPSEGKIDVVEERLRVGKRNAEQGRVRVRSYVVETPVEEEVSLRDETVHLERTPVDRAVGAGDGLRRPHDRSDRDRRGGCRLQGGAGHRGDQPREGGRHPDRDRPRHRSPHRGRSRGRAARPRQVSCSNLSRRRVCRRVSLVPNGCSPSGELSV